jgi:Ser/Thr protein kinase RdoA (MazF antagonist)
MAALIAAIRRHHLDAVTEQDRALLAAAQLSRLEGGRNNAAYACNISDQRACVKVYRANDRNRAEREWHALIALAALKLPEAPTPYRYDPDPALPIVVMQLVAGTPLGDRPLTDRQLTALHHAHARLFEITPSVLPRVALSAVGTDARQMLRRVEHAYAAHANTDGATPGARQALSCWQAWSTSPDPELLTAPRQSVFGRGDPNLRNCLWNGHTLRIIDFEYAGWSDRAHELADLIEHPESRATPDPTWQAFVDRFDLPDLERQRLHAARRLLALFWTSRMWPSPHEPACPRFAAQVQRTATLLEP